MDDLTKNKIQMFGAWCGFGFLAFIFTGWVVAGFLPPQSPSSSAQAVGALFASDYTQIRIGMVLVMFSALAFIPFGAVMTQFIARVEGGPGVLTYTIALGGVGNMVLSFYPAMWWLAAAYRPDRNGELISLLNDVSWLQFIGGATMLWAMPLAVMVAALSDKSAEPVFPRWTGYAMAWIVLAMLPDQLLFFFHGGPFAWNGIFGLYIPATAFSAYFVINFVMLRRAILRDRALLIVDPASV